METSNKSQMYNVLNLFLCFVYVVISIVLIGDGYHSGLLFSVVIFFVFIFISAFLSVYDFKYNKKYCNNLLIFLLFHCFAVVAFIFSLYTIMNIKIFIY